MYGELRDGRMPILMGGDHSLGIGSISAAARHCRATGRALRVLWLDAHADFNADRLTPSGNLHGMPVACLCGIGPEALCAIGGTVPAIAPACVSQIGIRSVDAGEKQLIHEMGLDVFDMRYIDEVGCAIDPVDLPNVGMNTTTEGEHDASRASVSASNERDRGRPFTVRQSDSGKSRRFTAARNICLLV